MTISNFSMKAMLTGNFPELACTVTELVQDEFYQEAIQIIHYTEKAFSDEELDQLSNELKIDTGEDLLKDKNGWYIRGDSGAKTIPHHLTELFLGAQKIK